MCGIFGFVASDSQQTIDIEKLEAIAVDTESRGKHSFGFAWIDSRNRMRMFKQTGRISRHLDALQMVVDAKMLIGHCRYATHGKIDNLNAHPHPSDGGWIIHNGVISHHAEINDEYSLNPITDCDSETIGLLIEELDGKLVDRVATTMREVARSPFAMMGLWRPNRMIVARAGNPLHFSQDREGVYLASLPHALRSAYSVKDGSLKSFGFRQGELTCESHQVLEVQRPAAIVTSKPKAEKIVEPKRKPIGLCVDRFDLFSKHD